MTTPTYYLGKLSTGQIVEELPLATCQWSKGINTAGGWSATASTGHPIITRDLFTLGESTVWVVLDDIIEFGGIVWDLKISPESGEISIGGEGIWSYYHHRTIRTTLTYAAVDMFTIVSGLLTAAHAIASGDTGMVLSFPTGATAGVVRTRTYHSYELKRYGEAIEELADADTGFEFLPIHYWNGSEPATALECHYRRRGRHLRTSWELGRHYGISGDYELGGSELANRVAGAGAGSDSSQLTSVATQDVGGRLRLEGVTDHKQTQSQGHLDAEVAQDLLRLREPRESFKLRSLRPDPLPAEWTVGDEVYVVGELAPGWMIDDSYRIMGYSAATDETGALAVDVDVAVGLPYGKRLPTMRQYAAATRKQLLRRVGVLERR